MVPDNVVETVAAEGRVLPHSRIGIDVASAAKQKLVMLLFRSRAHENHPELGVLIGHRQAHDVAIKAFSFSRSWTCRPTCPSFAIDGVLISHSPCIANS